MSNLSVVTGFRELYLISSPTLLKLQTWLAVEISVPSYVENLKRYEIQGLLI